MKCRNALGPAENNPLAEGQGGAARCLRIGRSARRRRRRRRLQSCRPCPPDGSLIAAVFFERKSTADTASRPSALLLSKTKSNDFVVVDFEFYLLRPELQPRRPFHCVYLADWRARCQQWPSRLCHSFIPVQSGTNRSTIHRNRVSNSI
jgi:hypothetical protein